MKPFDIQKSLVCAKSRNVPPKVVGLAKKKTQYMGEMYINQDSEFL